VHPTVDLHLHSTASDGNLAPEDVVARAAQADLGAIALTDHDTLAGVAAAIGAGERLGVRVIGGCEFSCAAPWGEMHVLGYFLPGTSDALDAFLAGCRADRVRRARAMVDRLRRLGLELTFDDVLQVSAGGALGRPHVARALVARGAAHDITEAFDKYLGRGRPGFVEKTLPAFRDVARIAHAVGGLVSAAHLKDRATRPVLERFRDDGLDALEVRHPSHSPEVRARLDALAGDLGLLRTGGSDWHGESEAEGSHGSIGSQDVPVAWLDALEARRAELMAGDAR
jgi:predicted metal-dependent phosphoesterase TrpH